MSYKISLTRKEDKQAMLNYLKICKMVLVLVLLSGCKKFVEVNAPTTSLTYDNVYTNDATATGVLTGLYTRISAGTLISTNLTSISLKSGLSADEFTLHGGATNSSTVLVQFYKNAIPTGGGITCWEPIYNYLEAVNAALDGISKSQTLSSSVKQQLLGEAKFMRAFCHFYLVTLFGDIPLAITSDYRINEVSSRIAKAQVYQQIVADLKDAKNLLSTKYLNGSLQPYSSISASERVRPTTWAAAALLARTYLYTNKYDSAEVEATYVINNTGFFNLVALNNSFLKNSAEAIWQLQPVNTGWNTEDARRFILPSSGPTANGNFPVYLSSFTLNAFEPGDLRRVVGNWINSRTVGSNTYYYPYKYKSATSGAAVTEYHMVLRLAEQYLIRAEARAQQNNLSGAAADLNTLRSPTRANLPSIIPTTQSAMLTSVAHERQVELFSEWGHRWLDLKRTNTVDAVMNIVSPQKGGTWNTNWQLYPLLASDILVNPNLTQNNGY